MKELPVIRLHHYGSWEYMVHQVYETLKAPILLIAL